MFSRLFTLTDRLSSLLIKGTVRLGAEWLSGITNVGNVWRSRQSAQSAVSEADRVQGQVRSLSGLIIGLLAAVVLLLLWATSPRTSVSQVINFFNLVTPQPNAEGGPIISSGDGVLTDANVLQGSGTVAFTMHISGQDDIFAIGLDDQQPTRLTSHPADDRDPAWSPDGEKLAFASRRDGNWELYVLDMFSGELTRLTFDLRYEAAPSWSPDGLWLAFEVYSDANLDIYLVRVDGSEGPFRLTFDPAPDFDPAWSTTGGGRELAYVSKRDGNQEVYILSLDDPSEELALNITNTPDVEEEHPSWSAGGLLLAYSANQDGTSLVFAKQTNNLAADGIVVGQGYAPSWSPDGVSLLYAARQGSRGLLLAGQFGNLGVSQEAVGLSGFADDPTWTAASLPRRLRGTILEASTEPIEPLFNERLQAPESIDAPYRLINLEGVDAPVPFLSDRVDDSFRSLRERLNEEAGWDILGRADHVWWDLDRPVEPGQSLQNWHKAGRAFDLTQGYIEGQTPLILPVLEQDGAEIYWRLYVRTAAQDGSQGEPLRSLPWDFAARWSGDVEAYDNGGKLFGQVPGGYYVDFTRLAEDYGWNGVPSDGSWRSNWPGVLFWQYEKQDGLTWNEAMREIYPDEELGRFFSTPTPFPSSTPGSTPTREPTATPFAVPSATPSEGAALSSHTIR